MNGVYMSSAAQTGHWGMHSWVLHNLCHKASDPKEKRLLFVSYVKNMRQKLWRMLQKLSRYLKIWRHRKARSQTLVWELRWSLDTGNRHRPRTACWNLYRKSVISPQPYAPCQDLFALNSARITSYLITLLEAKKKLRVSFTTLTCLIQFLEQ